MLQSVWSYPNMAKLSRERSSKSFFKRILLLSCRLIWFISLQLVAPFQLPTATAYNFSIQCQICQLTPGFTPSQIDTCCRYPKAINALLSAHPMIQSECKWQFRKDLWNCSGIGMPILREAALSETPEKAFISALASATIVHRITSACSLGELGSQCGCDYSRNGLEEPEGWVWGSCSDNISYGNYFAQRFLDGRERDVNTANSTAVRHASVHLHNNAVGRKVVRDNKVTRCRCHGVSGSCTSQTCWTELPEYYQVGDVLKMKYDNAIKVSVTRYSGILQYFDSILNIYKPATLSNLVYLEKPANYCSSQQNFTQNRQCLPQAMLDAKMRGQVKASSMQEFFPPCERFCCSGQYMTETVMMTETCNCSFVWCCDVQCQTCTVNVTRYRCTG